MKGSQSIFHLSLFPDDKFQFADSRLDELMLDPDADGLQVSEERTTLDCATPVTDTLPRSLMPLSKPPNRTIRITQS